MSFFFLALLLLSWTPSTLAVPSPTRKRSFKVDRVPNPNFKRYHGPSELLRTYQKYRMPIPKDLLDSLNDDPESGVQAETVPPNTVKLAHAEALTLGKTTIGQVSATPANAGIEFISPIRIGGQTVNVSLDSGSADLWVFSSEMPALATVNHAAFNPSLSPTFKRMPGYSFSITYGDGTGASGNVGTDTVDVGGATVTRQPVQLATSVSTAFLRDSDLSGILGLGFSQLSTVQPAKQKTFFENLMPSLAQPLFTAHLPRDRIGSYEFGFIDGTKYAGKLAWIRTDTSRGFWQVSTKGFSVGSKRTTLRAAPAIIDTGTTLMLVSKEMADGYYSHVPGAQQVPSAGGMTFPCNATLPDFLVDVGGRHTARIRGHDIKFSQLGGDSMFRYSGNSRRILTRHSLLRRHPVHHGLVSSLGRHLLPVAVCCVPRGQPLGGHGAQLWLGPGLLLDPAFSYQTFWIPSMFIERKRSRTTISREGESENSPYCQSMSVQELSPGVFAGCRPRRHLPLLACFLETPKRCGTTNSELHDSPFIADLGISVLTSRFAGLCGWPICHGRRGAPPN
jgi:hypothetical protein